MSTVISDPSILVSSAAGNQSSGRVTVLSGGGFVATWLTDQALMAQRYDAAGTAQGSAFVVHFGAGIGAGYAVAATQDNGFLASWTTLAQVEVASVTAANAVTTHLIASGGPWSDPVLALQGDGGFQVIYSTDRDAILNSGPGFEGLQYFRPVDAAGVPTAAQTELWLMQNHHVTAAGAVVLPGGTLAVASAFAFVNPPNPDYNYDQLILTLFNPAASPQRVAINLTGKTWMDPPLLTVLANGELLLTWSSALAPAWESDRSGHAVLGMIVNASGQVQRNTFQINTWAAGDQKVVDVVALADGGFFVVWNDFSELAGDGSPVANHYGQRFDSLGVPDGPQVLLNQGTSGAYAATDLAVLADGRLALAFTDTDLRGGAADRDVRVQLFQSLAEPRPADLIGTAAAETVTGAGSAADRIFGLAGHDYLLGLGGNDSLVGGDGDDKLEGGAGADVLMGGSGFDVAAFTASTQGLRVSLQNPAVNSGEAAGDTYSAIEGLSGSWFGDDLIGDAASNSLWGAQGDDVLWGMGHNDALFGNEGDDWLIGGEGADWLDGGEGFDTARYTYARDGVRADLKDWWGNTRDASGDRYVNLEALLGSQWGDDLLGDLAANRIDGDGGNDRIWGREGDDTLIGGGGADEFIFNAGWGHDTITDFRAGGADRLVFSGIAGLTSFSQLTITTGAAGTTVSFGADSVLLQGIASVSAADFLFF